MPAPISAPGAAPTPPKSAPMPAPMPAPAPTIPAFVPAFQYSSCAPFLSPSLLLPMPLKRFTAEEIRPSAPPIMPPAAPAPTPAAPAAVVAPLPSEPAKLPSVPPRPPCTARSVPSAPITEDVLPSCRRLESQLPADVRPVAAAVPPAAAPPVSRGVLAPLPSRNFPPDVRSFPPTAAPPSDGRKFFSALPRPLPDPLRRSLTFCP